MTREDVPADVVYAMTKGMFENLPDLTSAHPAAQGISLEYASRGSPVPLHPGAERYYREKGVLR
jgi:TRAP transporter TAXI family solute receptor